MKVNNWLEDKMREFNKNDVIRLIGSLFEMNESVYVLFLVKPDFIHKEKSQYILINTHTLFRWSNPKTIDGICHQLRFNRAKYIGRTDKLTQVVLNHEIDKSIIEEYGTIEME